MLHVHSASYTYRVRVCVCVLYTFTCTHNLAQSQHAPTPSIFTQHTHTHTHKSSVYSQLPLADVGMQTTRSNTAGTLQTCIHTHDIIFIHTYIQYTTIRE